MDFKSAWVSPFLESWCYFSVYGKLKRNKAWLTTLRQIYVRGRRARITRCYAPCLFDLFFLLFTPLVSSSTSPLSPFIFPSTHVYSLAFYSLRASTQHRPKCSSTRAQARSIASPGGVFLDVIIYQAVFLSRAYSFCRISGIFFLSYADPRDVATDSRRKYCRREKFLSNILYICVHRCVLFVSRVFDFETCEFRGYSSSIRADG